MLINNGIQSASLNYPAFEHSGIIRSILGYVLLRHEFELAMELMDKGAVLNSTEIDILVGLYHNISTTPRNLKDVVDFDQAFTVLNRVTTTSRINLVSLCDTHGNNPIHRVCLDMQAQNKESQKDTTNTNAYRDALRLLIGICPKWMLMENNNKRLPIEYCLRLVCDIDEEKKDTCINTNQLMLLDDIIKCLRETSEDIFNNLSKYRLKEYKKCVFYLKMICILHTISSQSSEKDKAGEICVKLIKIFTKVIENSEDEVPWTEVLLAFEKKQGKLNQVEFEKNMMDHFAYDLKTQLKQSIDTNGQSISHLELKDEMKDIDDATDINYDASMLHYHSMLLLYFFYFVAVNSAVICRLNLQKVLMQILTLTIKIKI